MKPNAMDRFINAIELVAAAFVGLVAADVFISVLLRYFFSIDIPDSYNFGQLLLGILIFWGIAATSYRGTHITVDLLWANVGPKWQRAIDVFATLVLLFVVRRGPGDISGAWSSPKWLWLGALLGTFIVFTITVVSPRIGTTATIALLVAGQLVAGTVIDRFGLFGFERIALSGPRVLGIALLAAGAALTLKR